ncbi:MULTISPECIES: mercuric resistance transcriptional repressor MerD [Ralstonia]|jgi:MerR family mercuric resistance operon transcriptional regulator|uniref:HTH-type transcriptional regulator MerD n=2 Tax=Ralstonia TaxID=48736 RepID=A0AAD2C0N1_9RALS|nr:MULTISPECIES: mercuric resistance transcriptional repressor MerD [Ralstonia]NOZ15225.1 mercuric resistance transcriptional repressor protein MerD [Betaproteobacteria bacterium]MCK8653293.1 mercuric resistance transcriptional repressor protein MerD [Ralstonia insidiosa]NOZ99187.1 mercuric resistance transcriptional repressor protein MerD [Betaproteobacteria bacterium]NYS10896.1 mercuric resistance transcriptional repressor protein MerD [Ralstonia pickettii]CAJ0804064.1 HTH-type transcription
MNAYTVSRLAHDASVSVNVVRDYALRGLLHPARRTEGGYWLYDARALARLRFVRAAFEAGIGLDELSRLCRALDANDRATLIECVEQLGQQIAARQATLCAVKAELNELACCADEVRAPS